MRIDANLGGLERLQNDGATRATARQRVSENPQDTGDRAELSTDGLSITDLSARVMANPEIRADRVDALRQQLSAGTYQPDARQIASAMMENLLAR